MRALHASPVELKRFSRGSDTVEADA
jgi:hypothetical protein